MSVNKLIKDIRNDSGLDRFEFSNLLGISPKHLQQIEEGSIPVSKPTLDKLAVLLKTDRYLLLLAAIEVDKDVAPAKQELFNELLPNVQQKMYMTIDINLLKQAGNQIRQD